VYDSLSLPCREHDDEHYPVVNVRQLHDVLALSNGLTKDLLHTRSEWEKHREDSRLGIAALRHKVTQTTADNPDIPTYKPNFIRDFKDTEENIPTMLSADGRSLEHKTTLIIPDHAAKAAQDLLVNPADTPREESPEGVSGGLEPEDSAQTLAWLITAGIPRGRAKVYMLQMVEDGFDTPEALATLEREDLEDYGVEDEYIERVLAHNRANEQAEEAEYEAQENFDAKYHTKPAEEPESPESDMAFYAKGLLNLGGNDDDVFSPKKSKSKVGFSESTTAFEDDYPTMSQSNATSTELRSDLPEVHAWLMSLGISYEEASEYYEMLEEDGFDTMDAVATLEAEDLEDYGFRSRAKKLVLDAVADAM